MSERFPQNPLDKKSCKSFNPENPDSDICRKDNNKGENP
jgi:hypothetical protein